MTEEMTIPKIRWEKRLRVLSYTLLLLLALVSLFVFSNWIIIRLYLNTPKGEPIQLHDTAPILLSAASLALFIFSSVVGIAAIFGWQELRRLLSEQVMNESQARFFEFQSDFQMRFKDLETEIRGRSASVIGYILGELSRDRKDRVGSRLLEQAVANCKEGFALLKDAKRPGPRMLAMNNYLYYLAISRKRVANIVTLMKYGDELREFGQNNEARHLILTSCWVVAEYSRDSKERSKARQYIKDILDEGKLSEDQEEEARQCVALLNSKE